jgi:NAD(P)H-flavin reductase
MDADAHLRTDPQLAKTSGGEQRAHVSLNSADVVQRHESGLARAHAYVCGPPPMVEAAIPLLGRLGVPEKRIYYDKFTFTGDPDKEAT